MREIHSRFREKCVSIFQFFTSLNHLLHALQYKVFSSNLVIMLIICCLFSHPKNSFKYEKITEYFESFKILHLFHQKKRKVDNHFFAETKLASEIPIIFSIISTLSFRNLLLGGSEISLEIFSIFPQIDHLFLMFYVSKFHIVQ